jgi:hypothetical protein
MGASPSKSVPNRRPPLRPPAHPSPPNQVEALYIEILRLRNYGAFQSCKISDSVRRKVDRKYQRTLRLQRSIHIVDLLSDHPQYVKSTVSFEQIFGQIFGPPKNLMECYRCGFANHFVFLMNFLYDSLEKFAEVVVTFFNRDPTCLPLFAFSTFPCFFGGFIGQEFCERAVTFLSAICRKAGESDMSDLFFTSFISSAYGFYNCLWRNLALALADKVRGNSQFPEIFGIVEGAIRSALPFLSRFHIQAFSLYCGISQHRSGSVVVEALLERPFLKVLGSSPHFTSPVNGQTFLSFLHELQAPINMMYLSRLLDIFISHRGSLDASPSLKMGLWRKLVPMIMSCADVSLISIILSDPCSTFADRANSDREPLPLTFEPVVINLHLEFLSPDTTDSCQSPFLLELFGVRPPAIPRLTEFRNHEVLARRWRKLESYADENGQSVTDFIVDNLGRFDPDFVLYCECQVLLAYQRNLDTVQEKMSIAELLQKLKHEFSMISESGFCLIHAYAAGYFREMLRRDHAVAMALRPINVITEVSPSVVFDTACVVLDSASFPVAPSMRLAEHRFACILTAWMEEHGKTPRTFAHCITHVLQASVVLTSIPDLALGRTLRVIIGFEERLLAIRRQTELDWEELFIYTLAHAQCPQLFRSFIVFHHFVFPCEQIVGKWKKRVHRIWEQFSVGMWHVLRRDAGFCETCADIQAVKQWFKLKEPLPAKGKKGNSKR